MAELKYLLPASTASGVNCKNAIAEKNPDDLKVQTVFLRTKARPNVYQVGSIDHHQEQVVEEAEGASFAERKENEAEAIAMATRKFNVKLRSSRLRDRHTKPYGDNCKVEINK